MKTPVLLLVLRLCPTAVGRSWTDVDTLHDPNAKDVSGIVYLQQADEFYINTLAPTQAPTTAEPTPSPTVSAMPSTRPSMQPSAVPSASPSASPTETPDPYPPNPTPPNAPDWYFNYDQRFGAKYGPGYLGTVQGQKNVQIGFKNNGWATVKNPPYPYDTWQEFSDQGWGPYKGVLANRAPNRNRCDNVGMQSPIDLRPGGGGQCLEHHEVRSRPGDFRLGSNSVLKLIESNKLRLKYQRRPCADLDNPACQEPDSPMADFPNGWGGMADVMHIDFKVTSEHLIQGKRYDAEMQIFHLHKDRRRMPTQSVLIEATDFGYNYYFDEAIKAFEYQYAVDSNRCANKKRRERQLLSHAHRVLGGGMESNFTDFEAWAEYSIETDDPDHEQRTRDMERRLQIGVWDPHHEMLVPSIHFWRYDGSLTEPPCGEWVSWFVCDRTMKISKSQLERLKRVLFTHVNADCEKTSVHYAHSVARPIQDAAGRPVWLCTYADFGPDKN